MYRLFNKVRRELIAEGRLFQYLGYAVGETVLIVTGILIALQINEWAEDRNDRRFERQTLSQIRANLKTDHERLTEIAMSRHKAAQSIDLVLAIDDPENAEDLKFWLADVMQADRFNVISNAYDVLKSRGLDIVKNDELRLTLGIYYDNWANEIKAHYADLQSAFEKRWIPFIISDIREFDWDKVADPYDAAELLQNSRFINTLKIEQDNHEGAIEKTEEMIDVNEKLQRLIDSELRN